MSERLVVVHTTSGPGLATIIKEALEAAGIPAVLSREGAGAAYGLTVGPMALVDILVPETRAAEARALLAEIQSGDRDDDEQSLA